jgi:O-antigen/teichoic acid export membrane protein
LSTARRLLKNFASLAFADFFNKVLAFIGVAYLARVLKAEGFGEIEFAQAIIVYFMLVANLGLSTFGAREIAKEKNSVKTYANQILSMKFCLSLLSYALLVIFVFSVRQPEEMRRLLLIYGFTILTFSLTLDWVFQGIEKMEYVALARMTTQAVYVGGLLLLVKNSEQLLRVPTIRIAAALTGALLLLYVFLKGYGTVRFQFDFQVWKQILKQSIPMGLSFILISIYYTFDTVMLGSMKGETVVGWYNAAYKVVLLFIGFAGLFGTAIFPVLARSYKESSVKLRRISRPSHRRGRNHPERSNHTVHLWS